MMKPAGHSTYLTVSEAVNLKTVHWFKDTMCWFEPACRETSTRSALLHPSEPDV